MRRLRGKTLKYFKALNTNALDIFMRGMWEGLTFNCYVRVNNVLKNNSNLTKKKKQRIKETFSQVINTPR